MQRTYIGHLPGIIPIIARREHEVAPLRSKNTVSPSLKESENYTASERTAFLPSVDYSVSFSTSTVNIVQQMARSAYS